jgi:hypothetical protein
VLIVRVGEGWRADSGHKLFIGKPPSESLNTDTNNHHRHNLGGGQRPPPIFFMPKNSCVLVTDLRLGRRGVHILKTSSNQFSLFTWTPL